MQPATALQNDIRQVTTAVGDGTVAALAASSILNDLKVKQKQTTDNYLKCKPH